MTPSQENKQFRIKDIAERAGVSTGTVDRVLHQRGEVSVETRDRVLAIAKSLNYQPNLIAQTLASKRAHEFAVLIPFGSKNNPYWEAPLKGIQKAQQELLHYSVKLNVQCFKTQDINDFLRKGQAIIESEPDGILLAPLFFEASQQFLSACEKLEIPVVFIDSELPYPHAVRFIGQNSCQAGYVAGRLLSVGNKNPGNYLVFNIIQETDQLHHLNDREHGFRSFFKDKQLSPNIESFNILDNQVDSIKSVLSTYAHQPENIQGIFTTGAKAYLLAQAMTELDLTTIRLLGFDLVKPNIQFLENEVIDFLISQQPEEQGYQGIQTLYAVCVQNNRLSAYKQSPIDIITRENLKNYIECR